MLDMKDNTSVPWVDSPHTPTPWSKFAESGDWWIQQCDAEGNPIGETVVSNANDMSAADMLFIVRAVNSFDAHQELANICTGILECLDQGDQWKKPARLHAAGLLRAALAKASKGMTDQEHDNQMEAQRQSYVNTILIALLLIERGQIEQAKQTLQERLPITLVRLMQAGQS